MNYLNALIMIGKFCLGISFIVGIHELGHMLFAKMFGMRVEQYMIGFPPKIFSFKWRETEYALGAIPVGGAVNIAGMIDESMDSSHVDQPKKPWEFRSKSKLKQLIVILGGIIFNLASAFLIYTALLSIAGGPHLPKETLNKHGIWPTPLGTTIGLERGDKILKKDNKDFKSYRELQTYLDDTLSYTILRKGKTIQVNANKSVIDAMKTGEPLIQPLIPFVIDSVVPHSVAAKAGLQKGDSIIAIHDQPTPYIQDVRLALHTHAGQKVFIKYKRGDLIFNREVVLNSDGKIGIHLASTLQQAYKQYSIPQASIASLYNIGNIINLQASGLVQIATGKISPSKAISGPIGMVKIFNASTDLYSFWAIIALLSIIIAFMNLLPIPALDGGHAMILLYEIVTRRKFSDSWRMRLQKVGMLLLLLLMLFALFNDLYKLLG